MLRAWTALLILFSGCFFACSTVKTTRLPEGGFRINCDKGMDDCVSRADKVCRDKGYTILGGFNQQKMLGGSSSSYRVATYSGELEVVCGLVDLAEEQPQERCVSLPAPTDASPTRERDQACVPGSTQHCVGPGGCGGGQTCLSDGSGYGPCDCGDADASAGPARAPAGDQGAPGGGSGESRSEGSQEADADPSVSSSSKDDGEPSAPALPGQAPPATPLQ